MNRRQLLATLGVVGAGGAIVSGTGAFTNVEANRDVSVAVAGDANAYLSLRALGPNGPYTDTNNGELGIDLTGSNETGAGGQGVNTNAVTVFGNLFEIQNQGTQDVETEVSPLTFVDTDSGNTLIVLVVPQTDFPSVVLSPGESETYSLIVDVYPGGTSPDVEIDDTLTVTGEAP